VKGFLLLAGLAAFFGGLILLNAGSSMFADFSTENVAGPGVDVFVLDKYPEDVLPLEVIVRGGSKTGLTHVLVYKNDSVIFQTRGEGATWGDRISSKGRGEDNAEIEIPVKGLRDENGISFEIQANYVCAMSSGGSYFENEQQEAMVYIYMPAGKSKLMDLMICLLYFGLWILFWFLVILLVEKISESNPGSEKDIAYPILGFLISGGIIGYWLFARPLAATLGITGGGIVFIFILVWLSGIVLAVYPIRKRLRAKKIL
jgi:hypothetical protein